ncbi:MAG: hypothetical protein M1812_005787 [Candelaria pacifica]|nr:MAG: hypothetical protein M1812_005787 [Candelaria pacifica]
METFKNLDEKIQNLRRQVSDTRNKLAQLTVELQEAESLSNVGVPEGQPTSQRRTQKSAEYKKYGRQLIVPEIGVLGQGRLKSTAVLIIGIGGLGCPAAAYLAGAGAGRIGLVDGDLVETSNLHRQILHNVETIGTAKVHSAMIYLQRLNPDVRYIPHAEGLTPENAIEIFNGYDIILDCTDNPATRYLISDTAVVLRKPLISASALRTEGQLMVLNSPPRPPGDPMGGPCYRCVFPKPPPADSVLSCGEGGILGPVVGVMGVLQALEAIKVIVADASSADTRAEKAPSLLLFSAFSDQQFRAVRLRPRRAKCAACSAEATVTKESLLSGSLDYIQFCGISNPVNILSEEERISAHEYKRLQEGVIKDHLLIDVRDEIQFRLVSLSGSINIPFSQIQSGISRNPDGLASSVKSNQFQTFDLDGLPSSLPPHAPIYVVCRFGNDSQLAVRRMKEAGLDQGGKRYIGDIKGGLRAWREEVDYQWPEY